jgi:hypothetical protein
LEKAKNLILILFVASLAVEYFTNTYNLFVYPEYITLVLSILVVASIIINFFSKQQKKKKFLNKEVVIVLAIIPFYGLLDYFTEFHLFTNFIIISIVLIIGTFIYKLFKNKLNK